MQALHVRKVFPDGDRVHTILRDINLTLCAGELVALIGPSGSGKSTLLHILGALDTAYEGSVTLHGDVLTGLSDSALAERRNQAMGFVFQSHNLLNHLSVLDNVMLPALFSVAPIDRTRARTLLEQVGLGDKLQRHPYQLSGGERQRVAIARALYQRPKIVLCDEPTGNLDGDTAQQIIALLHQLAKEGVAVLIATHDRHIVATSDRVLCLSDGILVTPSRTDEGITW